MCSVSQRYASHLYTDDTDPVQCFLDQDTLATRRSLEQHSQQLKVKCHGQTLKWDLTTPLIMVILVAQEICVRLYGASQSCD
jgi:hypothetical protein